MTQIAVLWLFLAAPASAASPPVAPARPADPVAAAFDKLVQDATNISGGNAGYKELAALGDRAVSRVTLEVRKNEDVRVRRACYTLLANAFASNEQAIDAVARYGLFDKDVGIRCQCASVLGDKKAYRSFRWLRILLDKTTGNDGQFLRFIAAKSLAQLGEAEILPVLYAAVTDDSAHFRYIGNTGLKALSGKNLEDFEGYNCFEGTYILGFEIPPPFDAIRNAESKARRMQAATAYFKWLKKDRPDLYKHVSFD